MSDVQNSIYRVMFMQNETTYEVYAKYLTEDSLMGFIEVEELLFHDTKSTLLVDPHAEKLQTEFKGVKRSYIPLHAILRIDEVAKEGAMQMQPSDKIKKDNVSHLPLKNS